MHRIDKLMLWVAVIGFLSSGLGTALAVGGDDPTLVAVGAIMTPINLWLVFVMLAFAWRQRKLCR
jgi:uncharacterized transporter YbjL